VSKTTGGTSRTVKTILAGGFDQQPLLNVPVPARAYGTSARFVRDAETLFGVDPTLH
jgi:hypothetical protein